jgi:hypothetical protein
MLKELHLVARTIYTFVAVFAFSGLAGLGFGDVIWTLGVIIFVSSFFFQYWVLHYALKNLNTVQKRLWFLIAWITGSLAGIVIITLMMPTFSDLGQYESVEALAHVMALWGSGYAAFSAAIVAATCARRAWTRHGSLG